MMGMMGMIDMMGMMGVLGKMVMMIMMGMMGMDVLVWMFTEVAKGNVLAKEARRTCCVLDYH